jgi:transcriptional regulator GlxA family with amidase domain
MASLMDNPRDKSVEIVKTAIAQGKTIAAQDYGVYILALAGALNGKKYAISSEEKDLIYGGIYQGEGIVQDGNIITSGVCPLLTKLTNKTDGTNKLTQKFIDALLSRQ